MDEMKNKQENEKVFEDTFGELLNNDEKTPEQMVIHQPKNTLDEVLFPEEEVKTLEADKQVQAAQNYIPELINDPEWEAFASRMPVPSLSKVQEKKAISLGFQELAKMKQYMLFTYRQMVNEYNRLYALFPLALSKDFEEAYTEPHKKLVSIMEDLENLIDGKINSIEAVKGDHRLYQSFEEQRLKVLHHILTHYDRRDAQKNNHSEK